MLPAMAVTMPMSELQFSWLRPGVLEVGDADAGLGSSESVAEPAAIEVEGRIRLLVPSKLGVAMLEFLLSHLRMHRHPMLWFQVHF